MRERRFWRDDRVYVCGTWQTEEGVERRRLRDRARQRARHAVMRQHPDEFASILAADPDRRPMRKRARALREVARRHPDEYADAYRLALLDEGYDAESQPCSSQSTTATIGAENECCPAACDDRAAFPNPVEGSEMDERTHAVAVGEVR